MATVTCECCKRIVRADHPQKLCWECQGRPATSGHVVPPTGLRDPQCPHMIPVTRS